MLVSMDTVPKYRFGVIIASLFLVVLIESYQVAGYFGAAFVVVATIVPAVFMPE